MLRLMLLLLLLLPLRLFPRGLRGQMSLFFIFFCKSSFRGLSSCRLQGTRGPWALLQGFPAIERGANRPQQLWKPYARGVYGADVTAGCHVSKPKKKKSQLVSDVVVDLAPCRVLRVPAGNRIHQLRVVKQQAPLPRERPMQLPHAYVKPRSQDKKGGDYCKTVCPVRQLTKLPLRPSTLCSWIQHGSFYFSPSPYPCFVDLVLVDFPQELELRFLAKREKERQASILLL